MSPSTVSAAPWQSWQYRSKSGRTCETYASPSVLGSGVESAARTSEEAAANNVAHVSSDKDAWTAAG
ncbi:MAG: hypothetical protein U0805_09255 [Pirellulales bacterium]